ncbi:MAG: DNA polymerase I, partial [Firmicutes bacterium]|nr:DNA polymerase I [Bacillota bacterium]
MASQKRVSGRDKLLLIDGNSILYRAFFALPSLTTSRGLYTNAVYGFATMLLTVLRSERPTHIAVAFDKGKMTFRHEVFPEYKGTRQQTPPELTGQFGMARELLDHLNMRYIELETFEADDIIGTLCSQSGGEDCDVVAVSGDRDLLQLVRPGVTVCLTRKGMTDLARYDEEAVRERYALSPGQIVDLKGLMGDTSDNIPGVPGVGEKTAIKLLSQFGTIEEMLDRLDEVQGDKLREKLRTHSQDALTSKQLATIKTDVPLADRLEDLRFEGLDPEVARGIFREYEFKSLIDRIPDWAICARGKEAVAGIAAPEDAKLASEGPVIAAGAAGTAATGGTAADAETAVDVRVIDWAEVAATVAGWQSPVAVLLDLAGDYQTGELHGVACASCDEAIYARWPTGPAASSADFAHWLSRP